MKKGEIYEGIIENVDFPNKGYVQVDDQKVLIKNGIPGQNVRFMIQKKRSGRDASWKFWRNPRLRQESRYAATFLHAADACTRQCPTRISLR